MECRTTLDLPVVKWAILRMAAAAVTKTMVEAEVVIGVAAEDAVGVEEVHVVAVVEDTIIAAAAAATTPMEDVVDEADTTTITTITINRLAVEMVEVRTSNNNNHPLPRKH
jgi:hypothetical protein